MKHLNLFLIGLVLMAISACNTTKAPFYSDEAKLWQDANQPTSQTPVHTLWLIGDTGELDGDNPPTNYTVNAMTQLMDLSDKQSTAVFLGDNVYPIGLVDSSHVDREVCVKILQSQLNPLKDYMGQTYFIPGNHDWNKHKAGGREAIIRQEKFIEEYYDNDRILFEPNNACGDPSVVKINKDLVMVFIDSQWWLQDWDKENKINRGCDIKTRGDLLKRVEEIIINHKNDQIVFMMHHPIKTNGHHGGYFSMKDHMFPLNHFKLWIPLPGLGSIYPTFRQVTGSVQDVTNKKNQELVYGIEGIAKKWRVECIFAYGHEHGLQYFEDGKLKYICSGAGGKTSYIQKGGEALYARSQRGFAKVDFYDNFESWVSFYTVAGPGEPAQLEYRRQLRTPRAGTQAEEKLYPPISIKDTTYAANPAFAAGGFKKFWLGDQYRDMWSTPVSTEVIDLESKYGGLTPIKKGGGMSSNSLRMQHESGKQYILRSIKKDYRKLVPENFGNLELLNVMKDQNSASHPFGALAIPALSRAAGVYYTEPKLMYLKHQRGLGNYNSQFPEELYLLEERPSGDWNDDPKFGNSSKIIGYADLLDKLQSKKNHHVDQAWVLKSRLFDMWIHDWDRHDDQWRWATFEEGDKKIYRPIPRDRDQAFYKFRGVVPYIVSRTVMKKFKGMGHEVKDIAYLNFNGKHFDRFFLNDLEWNEWKTIVEQLQANLTDQSIEDAMKAIPQEVQHLRNEELISKLKSRRGHMMKMAKKYYDFISKEVEIVGTDNKDQFVINRHEDGSVSITQNIARKNGESITRFDRTFYPNETKEVRIYGGRGKDTFTITGSDKNKIKIRIIGGEGKDQLENNTKSGIYVYDNKDGGMKWTGKVKDKTSKDISVNDYNRNEFKYNSDGYLFLFGSTPDDGLFLGLNYTWTKMGWRKSPFSSKHTLGFTTATGNQNAFTAHYNGHFVDKIGKLDFKPSIQADFRKNENYFGLGNESLSTDRPTEYNWVRMQSVSVLPELVYNMSKVSYLSFGPALESHDIKLTQGRVSTDEVLGFSSAELDRRFYGGVRLAQHLELVQGGSMPTNGIKLDMAIKYLHEADNSENVTQLDLGMVNYIQLLAKPKLVLANGIGYQKSWGDLQFYQHASLGNNTHLRGYRNARYRGESAFYHNMDLRMQLFTWDNTWLPMKVGMLGGYDYGRVWQKNEQSDKWHNSVTAGLWFDILGLVVVQPHYSWVGDEGEDDAFSFKMGFAF